MFMHSHHQEESKSSTRRLVKATLVGAVLASLGAAPVSAWSCCSFCITERAKCEVKCDSDKTSAENACKTQQTECKKDCAYPDEQRKDLCETECRDERDAAKR